MAEDPQPGIKPKIELDGAALPADVEVLLEQVAVDDHLHLPDMFLLSFRDAAHDVLQKVGAKIGSTVKISAPGAGSGSAELLIEGEVTALEAQYGSEGSRALIRGYDGSHRLHRGRNTQTFRNVKDSDIAQTIAQQAGLQPGTIDDSRTTHDHVSQLNMSNWDFLKGRGEGIGFELAVSEGKLHFRKPKSAQDAPSQGDLRSTDPLQLAFGKDLLEFRPRVSSAEQVKEVKVRGWDPKTKQPVIGTAPAGTTSSQLAAKPADYAAKFGNPTYLVYGAASKPAEAEAHAKSVAEQIGSAIAEADGVARGNPKLKAGSAVSVGVVAGEFSGRYTLTHTKHLFDARGYRTVFEVSGRQDRSLLGLVNPGGNGSSGPGGQPIYGVVVAVVTNNNDPENLLRVKLKFPWLSDNYESDWARMLQAGAGPDSGSSFLPETNDEVLVAFEFGDVRRPIVIGGLHNGKDKPRLGDGLVDNGKVKRRGFVSRKGHRVILFDDDSKSGIALLTSDGKLKIALDESKGEIRISSQGKIVIQAQGDLSLSSKQNVTIEAQSNLSLKGTAGAKIESSGEVEVSGQLIKLN
jgi:phage protein D